MVHLFASESISIRLANWQLTSYEDLDQLRSTTPLLQSTDLSRVWPVSRPGWEPVGLDWTRPKPILCGWVQVSSSPSLTSPMCTFCRRA